MSGSVVFTINHMLLSHIVSQALRPPPPPLHLLNQKT